MIVNKNAKAIFFDLDDTLLNSSESQYKAITRFKQKFMELESISEREFIMIWDKVTNEQYEKYAKREISFTEHRLNRMKNLFSSFNINITDREAENYFQIYLKIYEKCWALFDDTIEVIENLRNRYTLAIITNGDGFQQRKKLKNTKIEKYFKEIIVSSEVNVPKPNKEIFEIACNKLNIQAKDCIMCGDKFKSDIIGAINSGISAIWINRRNEKIEYEYQINHLKEILKMV